MKRSIGEQIRRNTVAIVSLAVAISALGYNSWRNELSEQNRNVRAAGFEALVTLGELQQIVFFAHYDDDVDRGNPRAGWTRVIVLEDLAALMPDEAAGSVSQLKSIWAENWTGLGSENDAEQRISAAIDEARRTTLQIMRELD